MINFVSSIDTIRASVTTETMSNFKPQIFNEKDLIAINLFCSQKEILKPENNFSKQHSNTFGLKCDRNVSLEENFLNLTIHSHATENDKLNSFNSLNDPTEPKSNIRKPIHIIDDKPNNIFNPNARINGIVIEDNKDLAFDDQVVRIIKHNLIDSFDAPVDQHNDSNEPIGNNDSMLDFNANINIDDSTIFIPDHIKLIFRSLDFTESFKFENNSHTNSVVEFLNSNDNTIIDFFIEIIDDMLEFIPDDIFEIDDLFILKDLLDLFQVNDFDLVKDFFQNFVSLYSK